MKKLQRRPMLMDQVVLALMHRAIDLGHKNLRGLLDLSSDDIVEKHKRRHTVPVTTEHAKGAEPGNACDCAIAHAVAELPEVYAAIIMRRVSYFLEKDERGNLKIYRYNSPDQARRLTIKFDRRLKTGRVVTVFGPRPPSMSLEAQRKYQRKLSRKPSSERGAGPKFNKLSYTRTLIPDRMLAPLKGAR